MNEAVSLSPAESLDDSDPAPLSLLESELESELEFELVSSALASCTSPFESLTDRSEEPDSHDAHEVSLLAVSTACGASLVSGFVPSLFASTIAFGSSGCPLPDASPAG